MSAASGPRAYYSEAALVGKSLFQCPPGDSPVRRALVECLAGEVGFCEHIADGRHTGEWSAFLLTGLPLSMMLCAACFAEGRQKFSGLRRRVDGGCDLCDRYTGRYHTLRARTQVGTGELYGIRQVTWWAEICADCLAASGGTP